MMIWNGVWPVRNYDHLSLCPPAYHIISHHIISLSLFLSQAHTPTHTQTQKQIESSKSWLFASDDLDDDGLRWCADLFVTAHLMSRIIKPCTSVYVCLRAHLLCISARSEVHVCVFMGAFMINEFVCVCVHAYLCSFFLVCCVYVTDIIWCRLVGVLRLQAVSQRLIDKWIRFANVITLIRKTAVGCWEQISWLQYLCFSLTFSWIAIDKMSFINIFFLDCIQNDWNPF